MSTAKKPTARAAAIKPLEARLEARQLRAHCIEQAIRINGGGAPSRVISTAKQLETYVTTGKVATSTAQ